MTATTLAGSAPAAAPAAIAPLSWLETAVAVLTAHRRPMRAREIVTAATELGCLPPSRTRTPWQSVNRDLHAALRRGDARIQAGPEPGQFHAAGLGVAAGTPAGAARRRAAAAVTVPRLPVEPLVALVDSRGGLRACGVRPLAGDSPERVRWAERLLRAYLRSRTRGWISVFDADELAVKALGVHPCQVWDDGWWEALEDLPAPVETVPALAAAG